MANPKGNPENLKRTGRPPGSKNKVPMQVAEMVRNALELAGKELQASDETGALKKLPASEAYLMAMALREPKSFMALVSKLMPAKVEGEIHVFEGAALVDRLQAGRELAAQQLKKAKRNGQHGVH